MSSYVGRSVFQKSIFGGAVVLLGEQDQLSYIYFVWMLFDSGDVPGYLAGGGIDSGLRGYQLLT